MSTKKALPIPAGLLLDFTKYITGETKMTEKNEILFPEQLRTFCDGECVLIEEKDEERFFYHAGRNYGMSDDEINKWIEESRENAFEYTRSWDCVLDELLYHLKDDIYYAEYYSREDRKKIRTFYRVEPTGDQDGVKTYCKHRADDCNLDEDALNAMLEAAFD